MPAAARAKLATALGSSAPPSDHATPQVVHALHDAFVAALAAGLRVSAAVALLGAILALWLIDPVRALPVDPRPSEQLRPEAAGA
jgi:hypothetical protein